PAAGEAPAPPAEQDRGSEIAGGTDVIPEPPPRREGQAPESLPIAAAPPTSHGAEETEAATTVATAGPPPPAEPAQPARSPTAAPPANDQAARIAQWKKDDFWSQPALAKQWDLDHFTIREEQQLGEQLNALILQLNTEDREADKQRVKAAAQPFLE